MHSDYHSIIIIIDLDWSYCSILDLQLGLYIAATLSVHLSHAPYKVTSEISLLWMIGRLQTYYSHVATLSFR